MHLFAGRAFCACGEKMYPPSNSPKYICRKCKNKIPIVDLDGIFQEQLKQFYVSPTAVAAHLAQSDDVLRAKAELLESTEAESARLQDEMQKTYQLYLRDGISVEGFKATYGPLEERVKQLRNEMPRLLAELDYMKIQHLSRDEVLSEARDLYSRWQDLTHGEKQRIVEAVVERVEIGKDDVSIALCYVPSASEIVAKTPQNHRDSSLRPA